MATERTRVPYRTESATVPISWAWLLQRVSAVLLLVFVGGHLWVEHMMNATTDEVMSRLSHWVFLGVDIGLLVSVVFHGLNGLRGVLGEYFAGSVRWLDKVLWGFGVFTVVWGADILWAFIFNHPFFVI